ncbi:hypothetical protein Dda_1062 [Drechslerella dactyloides]|uniref:Uncharacterized protein n=1 Tax=Drechslerella dactyloides TaxID=74499 RepID=A0AAD6NN51_DREDA|nr:hypothetical protein Dda_1062 [Drechslerella dactyloides]
MPNTGARGFLASGAILIGLSSAPALVAGLTASSPIAIPLAITSVVIITVGAIGVVIVYIRDRRASRRAIEKSLFGKVLNRQERRKLAPLYQAGKARVRADAKADRAALYAEEKLRKRELKKVTKNHSLVDILNVMAAKPSDVIITATIDAEERVVLMLWL